MLSSTIIKSGTVIHSDELAAYNNLHKFGFPHSAVQHSKYVFARGEVTTNRIENVLLNKV